ncbi:MAG: hypothetical protein ACRBF0_25225 [Calditrichia bacterium]
MNEKPNQLNQSNGQAILALWVGIALCLYTGDILLYKVLAGLVFLIAVTLRCYQNFEEGRTLAFWVIVAGATNLIDFFPSNIRIDILGIDFILVAVGFMHYFANEEALSKYLTGLFKKEISEEDKEAGELALKNHFKKKFSNKGIAELELIAKDDKFLPKAIEAAEELLAERKSGESTESE